MGYLKIWTSAKAAMVMEALQPAFDRLEDIPEHQIIAFDEDADPVMAEAGEVVLVMGSKCLKSLQAHKLVHGGRTVNSLRQHPQACPEGGFYLTTLDPFLIRTQADAPSIIRQDLALAARFATTGSLDAPLGNYREVEDFTDLIVELDRRISEADGYIELACDTETLGLHPEAEGAKLVTIQFTLDAGTADVLFFEEDGTVSEFNHSAIEWMLTHERILLSGANWKYDSRWIHRHMGIKCTNLTRDTMLMGSMIDENRSNSLKTHAWEYTRLGGYDQLDGLGYDKGRMDLIPRDVLTPYAGCDTDVTIQSARMMKKEMSNAPALIRLYRKIVLPASQGFEAMEHEGVHVNLEKFAQLRHDLSDAIDTHEQEMLDLIPNRLKAKYADNLSITRPALLRDYFFTPYGLNLKPKMRTAKADEASTAKAHLMMFADVPEAAAFITALEQHGSANKTRSTFVDGFLKHLRADGRFHPNYMLFVGSMFGDDDDDAGATTGRTSCKEPAFQTIPKKTKWAKRLRACYDAPPGMMMVAFDFSQGELKVVACVAQEDNMIAAFKKGMDLHCVTGAEFMGLSYEQFLALEQTDIFTYTLMRTGAKAGNFGLLYGMQTQGFREYARVNYGFSMTMDEAEERRDKFLNKLYPKLTSYHKNQEKFVMKNGYVESPLGRRRNLPLVNSPDQGTARAAVRQGINAPIQSTLNDMTFYALVEMQRHIPELRFCGMVHDQLIAYVPEERAYELAAKAKQVMDNLPLRKEFDWDHDLQFTSDGEVGYDMASLKKI